ncbi:autotransporter outer membrane beta-barrel domain-containing protein [Variovorax sp. YR752]|uniref:autotransporter outer membrane beta-barrel domain-containing protein n=1 Tax=Variovorax sp. YR752 TaxID=1884383 RepID=UPI0031380E6B
MAIRVWNLAPGLTSALFGIAAWAQPLPAWAACVPAGVATAPVPLMFSMSMPWNLLTDTFCALPAAAPKAFVLSVPRGAGSRRPQVILNEGTLNVRVASGVASRSVSLTLDGGDDAADTTSVAARAVGIDGRGVADWIGNTGTVSVLASASVKNFDAELNLADLSHGDTSIGVSSRAVGIDADGGGAKGHGKGHGHGTGAIVNSGTVSARATSTVGSVDIELNALDAATGDSRVAIDATAIGLRGGRDTGRIDNQGAVHATATATLREVGVTATLLDATVLDGSGKDAPSLPSSVEASAVGIDATRSRDTVDLRHSGTLRATATADAHSTLVSVSSEGLPDLSWSLPLRGEPAEFSVGSLSRAIGIVSGSSGDRLTLTGDIVAAASSTATQESVNVGIAVFDLKLPTLARDLADAGTTARAEATGVDSGQGNDRLSVSGTVDASAVSKASATTVSVDIAELSVDLLPGVPSIPFGVSLVVTDTATEARTTTTAITAGSGDDLLANRGTVRSDARAESGSTSVAAGLNMAYGKGDNTFAVDLIAARAVSDAGADAVGLDTGAGRDSLRHDGRATVNATADAHAVAAIVDVAGTLKGKGGAVSGALTDTSAIGTARASGLQAGDGDDAIASTGRLDVGAIADVNAVSVSSTIGIVQQGLVAGATLSRSASTATATAIGIDGGAGHDLIAQSGPLTARAEADADAVSVSVTIAGTAKGIEGGAALADAHTTASATAVGIRTGGETVGSGHDKDGRAVHDNRKGANTGCHPCAPEAGVINTGTIAVDADANADAVGVGAKIGVAKTGVALGAALARTGSTSTSSAIGIQADARDDTIVNAGRIGLRSGADGDAVSVSLTVEGTASGLAAGAALADASVTATAGASGIAAGAGDDRIANTGSIASSTVAASATAVSVAPSVLIAKQGAALGAALADTSASATTAVAGIDGGEGRDELNNEGSITLRNAKAQAEAVGVSLQIAVAKEGLAAGAGLARSDSDAALSATGLGGGAGDDLLVNSGTVTLRQLGARADAVSVAAVLSGAKDGVALGAALVDADASATLSASGLAGGDGRDILANRGAIRIDGLGADADATGVSVGFTFALQGLAAGAALAETGARALATVRGIDGGSGGDLLLNEGTLALSNLRADADAVSVSAKLAGAQDGVALAAGLADASGSASVAARAIDGGSGNDRIVNRSALTATGVAADANAAGISVALAGVNAGVAAGVSLADTSATARAEAKGMDGGDGHDSLWNHSGITLTQVTADADAVSVGVTLNAALSGGVAGGAALGRAQGRASARATGMDGGAGDDGLVNKGRITIDGVVADTDAVGVSAQLGVTNAGVAIGAALVDTAATARAEARGLDGGTGDDHLLNDGEITLRNVKAQADAVSVGVTVNAALSAGVAAGVALTDGSGTAHVRADGLSGGDGRDTLVNTGKIRIESALADAKAAGVSVTLNASLAGVAAGAALADTRATAVTEVAGLAGGAGDDIVYGDDSVDVTGQAKAGALSLALQISGAVGVAGGATITDASSTATSTVMGLDGGAGRDAIVNAGTVKASSTAAAESTAISLGISVGVGGDATLADARSSATATAVGLHDSAGAPDAVCGRGGHDGKSGCRSGDDHHPDAPADLVDNRGAVTASATASAKGTSIAGNLRGFALGETSNSSAASAAGILTHDSRDLVHNEGTITTTSSATTQGLSVAVTLGGKALGDASSTAAATGIGIDTGAGNDQIANLAAIRVDARSNARATAVSVGLVGVAEADAATTALATARGIAGGEGDDRILNQSSVNANAGLPGQRKGDGVCSSAAGGACAKASTVSVTLAGYGEADAGSTATSAAVGLDGGAGRDALDNRGAVTAGALARGRADGVAVAVFGAADASASSTIAASASGMTGGLGDDALHNAGAVRAEAAAESFTRGFAVTVAGKAGSAGSSVTSASAFGLAGGDGRDRIDNAAAGTLNVRADTQATVQSSSWTFAGAAAAQATLGAQTLATGIAGGAGADWIDNAGSIGVVTASTLTANGRGSAIFGGAKAGSKISAATVATGIDAGADNDVVINRGQALATAGANMLAHTASVSFAGSAATTEFVTAEAGATAIAAGDGADAVYNEGKARAVVTAVAQTEGSASTDLAGNAQASGTVAATATARGIDGGLGAGLVINRGSVGAEVSGQSWATHGSNSGVFFSDAGVVASSSARLAAAGITLGDGDHGVKNAGTVAVLASTGAGDAGADGSKEGIYARANAEGGDFDIFTGDGDAAGTATARAEMTLDGITVGIGHSVVRNDGRISVRTGADGARATAYADPNGGAVTVDGDGAGWASSTMTSTARGIAAAGGRVQVANLGDITLDVSPAASSVVDADGGSSGDTDVFLDAQVSSQALGIVLGSGRHGVLNSGTISVRNAASASIDGDANGQGVDGDGRVGFGIALSQQPGHARVDAVTTGIDVGGSGAWVEQQGSITLNDDAAASATARADSDFTGDANAFARSGIGAALYGLRTRGAQGWVKNSGTISLATEPSAGSYASGRASGNGSRAWGTAIARSEIDTRLRGIAAEGAGSRILNTGRIALAADLSTSTRGEAESNLDGNSRAEATASGVLRAYGIEAAGAAAVVEQRGSIDLRLAASGQATTWSRADGALARTRAIAESQARLDVQAIGLRVADATGVLMQAGTVTVSSRASTSTVTDTDAPGLPKGVENNYSLATATAYGLSVGTTQPRLLIANSGAMRVSASSTAQAVAEGSTYMHTEELATSRAYGIATGGTADFTLRNDGRITATASASSDWNDLGQGPIAQAFGIRSGSGNDTVVQNGSIVATQRSNGVAARGTAISTGAGNDLVMLGDGSVTDGRIDLGSGHDTLSLEGTPVIRGSISGGLAASASSPGSLTLQLLNSGRFAGELPGNITVKAGPGTFSLATLKVMDRIEVRDGTLALDSGYSFAAHGNFVATVRGDGTHGRFHVRGQASLAGRMTVVDARDAFVDGTTYDVLTADGGIRAGTAFAAIELPQPTRLLSFDAQQLRDRVRITADVQSYTSVAKDKGERAIARQLDRIVPLATGELRYTLGAIQRLSSDSEFSAAFDALDPALHQRHSRASLGGPRRHAQTLHDRMSTLRIGTLAAPDGPPARLAPGGGDGASFGHGMWKTSFTQQGRQGVEHDVDGLALGFDRRIGQTLTAGVSFARADNEVRPGVTRVGLDSDQTTIRSGLAAVYGSYFDRRWHLSGTLSTGRNDYRTQRTIVVGPLGSAANSQHRGTLLATSLEAGYLVPAGRGWLDPFVSVQHTQLKEQGFSEAGSGAAGLVIAARSTRELLSTLGMRWSQIFERGNGAFATPELSLGWLRDFSPASRIHASYVGAPGAGFAIDGEPVLRNGAVVGLGFNYRTTRGMTGAIRYSGELRGADTAHSVIGEFRYEF